MSLSIGVVEKEYNQLLKRKEHNYKNPYKDLKKT